MNKLLAAALIVVAGYYAIEEYGGGFPSVSGTGSGGAGIAKYSNSSGKVAGAAAGVVGN